MPDWKAVKRDANRRALRGNPQEFAEWRLVWTPGLVTLKSQLMPKSSANLYRTAIIEGCLMNPKVIAVELDLSEAARLTAAGH